MSATLDIGLTGLRAAQAQLDITSHNIANASVEGYTRQRAVTRSRELRGSDGLSLIDGGVDIEGVERISDRWLARHLRSQLADKSYQEALLERLNDIETVLNDTDDTGIANALDEFYGTLSDLADKPEDSGVRTTVLSAAKTLASRIRNVNEQLEKTALENRLQIEDTIDQVNRDLEQAASLGRAIAVGMANGDNVGDLQDERDRVLTRLAEQLGAQITVTQDERYASVSVGGVTLLTDRTAVQLEVDGTGVTIAGSGTAIDVTGGAVGAMLELRDTLIPQRQAEIDDLAGAIITGFNAIHSAGYGLDGSTGLDLFSGTDSSDIAVAITSSAKVAASADGAVGNNENAEAMLAVRETPLLGPGTTLTIEQYYQEVVGGLAGEINTADTVLSGLELSVSDLLNSRESIHGVSLDEEMTNLIRFQQAYSAAARVVTVADEMMNTILNLGR